MRKTQYRKRVLVKNTVFLSSRGGYISFYMLTCKIYRKQMSSAVISSDLIQAPRASASAQPSPAPSCARLTAKISPNESHLSLLRRQNCVSFLPGLLLLHSLISQSNPILG